MTVPKSKFVTTINAEAQRVWKVLWFDATYREWTKVFCPPDENGVGGESRAVSDWKLGSKVHFLSSDDKGMYSKISKLEVNKYITFTHIGDIVDGKEQPPATWSGGNEAYTLTEEKTDDGKIKTIVQVDLDNSDPSFADFFGQTFPSALECVKKLSENPVLLKASGKVNEQIEKVWDAWTKEEHIKNWAGSSDWTTTHAESDVRVGGKYHIRNEKKDGTSLDEKGSYTAVEEYKLLEFMSDNGHFGSFIFESIDNGEVLITVKEEATDESPWDEQQKVLDGMFDNFKQYVESNKKPKIANDTDNKE